MSNFTLLSIYIFLRVADILTTSYALIRDPNVTEMNPFTNSYIRSGSFPLYNLIASLFVLFFLIWLERYQTIFRLTTISFIILNTIVVTINLIIILFFL